MSGIEHFQQEIEDIEHSIARLGVVLNIDWQDAAQVRQLVREALAWHGDNAIPSREQDAQQHAKLELFGLMQLMLTVMKQSAEEGIETHGGELWKTLGRALWREIELRHAETEQRDGDAD